MLQDVLHAFVGDFCMLWADIDMDAELNAINDEHSLVEETTDSCKVDFIEIVPLVRDTDGFCTTECVSGDWSAEVKQENLTVVKQEPDDVCGVH